MQVLFGLAMVAKNSGACSLARYVATIAKPNKTCIVYFDNSSTIQEIEEYVDSLLKNNAEFVNASELTGLNLTIRGEKP